MNNLLLTLAAGVFFILVLHSAIRFFTSLPSIKTALITFVVLCSVYIPLVLVDRPNIDVFAIQFAIYGVTIYLLTILHGQANINKKLISEGQDIKKGWHWGPALIISFFVVVIVVNSVFLTVAQQGSDSNLKGMFIPKLKSGNEVTSYFPGIVEHNYHKKEDQYNEYQKRLGKQRERGWKIKFGWDEKPIANRQATFLISLKNAKNEAITKAKVSGSFQRGNTSSQDQPVTLIEAKDGLYKADITLRFPGRWELLLKVDSPQGDYDLKATTEVFE